jgi:uncharacterized protein (TIGR02145 family)
MPLDEAENDERVIFAAIMIKNIPRFIPMHSLLVVVMAAGVTSCYKESVIEQGGPIGNTTVNPPPPPPPQNTVTDVDGNVYNFVQIGEQVWMTSNLRVKRYRNGQNITNVSDSASWKLQTTGAWCRYPGSTTSQAEATYGVLYNGYAATDTRGLCPTGWRVANSNDWTQLSLFLGSASATGGKIKDTGTQRWAAPNTNATNEVGFSAQPSGGRPSTNVDFAGKFLEASWWAPSGSTGISDQILYVTHDTGNLYGLTDHKRRGACVRCIRN